MSITSDSHVIVSGALVACGDVLKTSIAPVVSNSAVSKGGVAEEHYQYRTIPIRQLH